MIIPSIDIQNGYAVQLIAGKTKIIDGEDPFLWADQFSVASQIAVIDLDAAMSIGDNRALIISLISKYNCRVGGGIRTVAYAKELLNAGARQIIIGTNATSEFLSQLPKERIIAALDARQGKVVVEGWNIDTNISVEQRIVELSPYVSGFLITLVENEGSLNGIDIPRCLELKKLCPNIQLTVAGGVHSTEEIAILDEAGIDVQVGMALYTKQISYADTVIAPLVRRLPNQLWPTVICNEQGVALGLAWSNQESISAAVQQRKGIYYSRSRSSLWTKGQTSGATQSLLRIDLDCDRDCLRFTVRQSGSGFCHKETFSCWGPTVGLAALSETILERKNYSVPGSYTNRLLTEDELLPAKIMEEAAELVTATTKINRTEEAADLLFFLMVYLVRNGIPLSEIDYELDRRALRITRRGGDKKIEINSVVVGGN